jgi:hypothetical protein
MKLRMHLIQNQNAVYRDLYGIIYTVVSLPYKHYKIISQGKINDQNGSRE